MCDLPANFALGEGSCSTVRSYRPSFSDHQLASLPRAPRGAAGAANRKKRLLTSEIELLGDLRTGLCTTHDQHGAGLPHPQGTLATKPADPVLGWAIAFLRRMQLLTGKHGDV